MSMCSQSRRDFLRRAIAAGISVPLAENACLSRAESTRPDSKSPNEKLDIAVIGVDGRGKANLDGVANENIIALCDIDDERLQFAAKQFPHARLFKDYRQLLESTKLDALVVSTPDHTHAIPVVSALQLGLDVYCEKPLAHSVWEVRQMRDWAKKQGSVTQMGTQIHATDNYRRVVELIQAGAIGKVDRVHIWHPNSSKPGKRSPSGTPPAHIDYDLWIGPAPLRPFDLSHFHFNWRYWWDFGGGTLADLGCHYIDLPYWALKLGNPESIRAQGEKTYIGDNEVPDNLRVDYQFPARDNLSSVHLTWYHGTLRPEGSEEYEKNAAVLFEGTQGRLLADYSTLRIYSEQDGVIATPVEPIPASIGHHQEWIEACKMRGETTCNFDYSGALAETVLLGNVAYRVGHELQWEHQSLQATNCPEAEQYIRREYRQGWEL